MIITTSHGPAVLRNVEHTAHATIFSSTPHRSRACRRSETNSCRKGSEPLVVQKNSHHRINQLGKAGITPYGRVHIGNSRGVHRAALRCQSFQMSAAAVFCKRHLSCQIGRAFDPQNERLGNSTGQFRRHHEASFDRPRAASDRWSGLRGLYALLNHGNQRAWLTVRSLRCRRQCQASTLVQIRP